MTVVEFDPEHVQIIMRRKPRIRNLGRRGDRAVIEDRANVTVARHIYQWVAFCRDHKRKVLPHEVPNRHNRRAAAARARQS